MAVPEKGYPSIFSGSGASCRRGRGNFGTGIGYGGCDFDRGLGLD